MSHETHCNQGEYEGSCKYGEASTCPMLKEPTPQEQRANSRFNTDDERKWLATTDPQPQEQTKDSSTTSPDETPVAVTHISHDRLLELLYYDPLSGVFSWRVQQGRSKIGNATGSLNSNGYLRIRVDGKRYLSHRLAWFYVNGVWPNGELDHKDRIKTNNAYSNLRKATRSQNMANIDTSAMNKSGHKGALFHKKSRKWIAQISNKGKSVHLGTFNSPELAHAAYVGAAKILRGNFNHV